MKEKNGFTYNKGAIFIDNDIAHVLEITTDGETPGGTECEDYTAKCGQESQSWSMPANGIEGAQFVESLEVAEKMGAKRCDICFPQITPREEISVRKTI